MLDMDTSKDKSPVKSLYERFILYADKIGRILFEEKKNINFVNILQKTKRTLKRILKGKPKKKTFIKKIEKPKVNIREVFHNVIADEKYIQRLTGIIILLLLFGILLLFILWIFFAVISFVLQSVSIWIVVLVTACFLAPVVLGLSVVLAKRYDYE
jgi:ABC-type multidrug transport system fused ATPase/permease subunit